MDCRAYDSNIQVHQKIKSDLTNRPLSKLLESARAIRYSGLGVCSVGPVGDSFG